MHDDRLAVFKLAFFLAAIFGPMCLPHAAAVAAGKWRARAARRHP